MTEPFTLPSLYWLLPLPFLLMGCSVYFLRRGAVFAFLVGFVISWAVYSSLYDYFMGNWLARQRVYAIIFRDYPEDKEFFVTQHLAAYKSGRQRGLARKAEEMKIVMMANLVRYYIADTPTKVISQYITSQVWLLDALYHKNRYLCDRYVSQTGANFLPVWQATGSKLFLESLRYDPEMITEAVDNPEPVSPDDRQRAFTLYGNLLKSIHDAGVAIQRTPTCDAVYEEFYLLLKMPPKDAALIVKLLFSADNLKMPGKAATPILQQLLPFH